MPFKIAIIGRPNVGKSTLFNRLAGKRLALVHDEPGMTRDRKEATGKLMDMPLQLIDTAGLEEGHEESLEGKMRMQTEKAFAQADLILFLFDARAGVTPLDSHFADLLRKQTVPVVLVANKCEGKAILDQIYEAYSLGLGDPIPVSAEHGEGLGDLYQAMLPHYEKVTEEEEIAKAEASHAKKMAAMDEDDPDFDPDAEEEAEDNSPLSLAIIGRPNVGKSTLVNALLDDDRMLTGPEAGVTRDSIASDWTFENRPIRLIDTAGVRRRSKIKERMEKISVSSTLREIDMAQVVVLLLDATQPMEKQDLKLARRVTDEGRALIIALNKWDKVEKKAETIRALNDRLERSLTQVTGVPVVTLSALKKQGLGKVMREVFNLYEIWNKRIQTSVLNHWLEEMLVKHPPPLGSNGRRIKLRYMTQTAARPPRFAIFCNHPDALPESYSRYLTKGLRDSFGMSGVAIRIALRKRENPYAS